MKRAVLLSLVTIAAALGQQGGGGTPAKPQSPKKSTKPFTPPTIIPMTDPIVAKDEACAKDFAKMLDMEGLALRKYVAELVKFGCVRQIEGVFYVNPTSVILHKMGQRQVSLQRVHLIPTAGGISVDGWVLGLQVETLEAVQIAVKRAVAEQLAADQKR